MPMARAASSTATSSTCSAISRKFRVRAMPTTALTIAWFTESRPRARDAVVSSFTKVALERSAELTAAQRQKLTEYFIDLHSKLPPYQKREVEAAARKIAGNDVADLLQGKSPDNLEIHRDYHQAVEDGQKRVAAQ